MAQTYRLEPDGQPPLGVALEALEEALLGLRSEAGRLHDRIRVLRRAYDQVIAASADGSPRGTDVDGPARLTRRERLVATLAAEGRTNAEVAAHLHVSEHTVKTQMRSVLRKLRVASRWELRAVL